MVYRLVVRGAEVNAYQSIEQAMAELRALRASGEVDARLIAEVRGNECYDWCLRESSIEAFLKCLQECEEDALTLTLPPPLEHDDLGV